MAKQENIPMKLSRNYILRTVYGHTLRFEKDVVRNVPRICYRDALGIGAERADGKPSADAFEEPKPIEEVTNPGDRNALILEAYIKLSEENDPDSFTATGLPKVAVMKKMTSIQNLSTKEIGRVIADYNEEQFNSA